MKKIVFIIPYFGKWPSYFSMWLKSIKANPTIDFLIITDLEIGVGLSENIKILNWTFSKLKKHFQKFFDFEISLDRYYKLCDYKPVYGFVFQKYVQQYDFWGHGDIDCVFGDIRKFIDPLLDDFDAIGAYGHMSLYRNCDKINTCFKKDGAVFNYKEVFSSNYDFAFDETAGLKRILKKQGIRCKYHWDFMANICTAYKSFQIGRHKTCDITNYKKQIFIWEKGNVFQCYLENSKVCYREFLYIHFQKKVPVPDENITDSCYILYNKMLPRFDSDSDIKLLKDKKISRKTNIMYLEKMNWIIKKIIFYIKLDRKQRKIYNKKRRYR